MFHSSHTLPRLLTTFAAIVALAVPASAGAYTDLRNPDSKGVATVTQAAGGGYTDLRNPDSREVAVASQARGGDYADLRNPDSRDVTSTPQPVVTAAPQAPAVVDEPGFDWGDAGIGAGAVLGLAMITMSVMFGAVHRRNRSATA